MTVAKLTSIPKAVTLCAFGLCCASSSFAQHKTGPQRSGHPDLCQLYGWWAPAGTSDYSQGGFFIHANGSRPLIGSTTRWVPGQGVPSTYENGRLHAPFDLLRYDAATATLRTPKGRIYRRFVTYVEGGCPDTDHAFTNLDSAPH
jgi:hypothetical protein